MAVIVSSERKERKREKLQLAWGEPRAIQFSLRFLSELAWAAKNDCTAYHN